MTFRIETEADVQRALRELREAVDRIEHKTSTVQLDGNLVLERVRALAFVAQQVAPWADVYRTVVEPHYELAMGWYFRALSQSSDPATADENAEMEAATSLKRSLTELSAEFGHPSPSAN